MTNTQQNPPAPVILPRYAPHLHQPQLAPYYGQSVYVGPSAVPPPSAPKPVKAKRRTAEDEAIREDTSSRIASSIAADRHAALFPDVEKPFKSPVDVVQRLLPYHVFQTPQEDLDYVSGKNRKGKAKADLDEEEDKGGSMAHSTMETEVALDCFKRFRTLEQRFRDAQTKCGKRLAPDTQQYLNAQLALESDRAELHLLHNELAAARAELARVRPSFQPPPLPKPQPPPPSIVPQQQQQQPHMGYYPGYYNPYQYGYAHMQGLQMAPPQPQPQQVPQQPVTIALPVAALPLFHQIGIYPVPLASVSPPPHPQPAAVITQMNETTVTMTISIWLLQPYQMPGLASILSNLNAAQAQAQAQNNGAAATAVP